jgi:hypothetical protein
MEINMTNLAQQMTATALAAQEEAKEAACLEAEKKKIERESWFTQGCNNANSEFPEILNTIKECASKGYRKHSISIQSMDDSYSLSDYQLGRDKRLKELLTENGFKYTTYSFDMEPCGSDPISFDTLYYYGIEVTW